MKKWMKKMAIIGVGLFLAGISVASIGAAIGGAAVGLDFLIDKEKSIQNKYDWGDSEEIFDDTEQMPEETDVPDEMEWPSEAEEVPDEVKEFLPPGVDQILAPTVQTDEQVPENAGAESLESLPMGNVTSV